MKLNLDWLNRRKKFLENIKRFKPTKDRIQTVSQLIYMHNAIHESVRGWANWFNNWISIELNKKMNIVEEGVVVLTDEELKYLHDKMQQFALEYIKTDIKITKIIDKRASKKSKTMAKKVIEKLNRMIV